MRSTWRLISPQVGAALRLGTVLERFIAHLLGIEVAIEPLVEANNVTFTWYVGLDAAGTKIGDALWNGESSTMPTVRA